MNDHRLQNFLDPPADPKIPPHAQDVIQDELDQRRYEDMAAYASMVEEDQGSSTFGKEEFGAMETFDEPDLVDGSINLHDLPTQSIEADEAMEVVQSVDDDGFSAGGEVASGHAVTQVEEEAGLNEEEAEALVRAYAEAEEKLREILRAKQIVDQIIGEMVMEAALMARASDTVQEICSESSDIMLLSTETVDKLMKYLWEEYPAEERAEYLETIFEEREDEVIPLVAELAEESDLGVQRR